MNQPNRKTNRPLELTARSINIIEQLRTAVIILDLDGRITHFNRTAETYSGFRASEVLGKRPWDFLIGKNDAEILKQAFEDLKTTGLQTEMETEWITQNGQNRILRWSNAPVVDEEGKLRWIVDTFVDLTEEHEFERKLAQSKEEIELERTISLFLSETSYRIYSSPLDRRKRLELAVRLPIPFLGDWAIAAIEEEESNEYEVLGYHRDPTSQGALAQILSWQHLCHGIQPNKNPLGASSIADRVLLRTLGWETFTCIPIEGLAPSNKGMVLIASRDRAREATMDCQRVALEYIRRITVAIDAASLYERSVHAVLLRDRFLSTASHELRTPLTSLRMQIDMLHLQRNNLDFLQGTKGLRVMDGMKEQLTRISKIVLEMIDSVALESGKVKIEREECELRELVQSIILELDAFIAATGAEIHFVPGPPVKGKWDRFRIGQIITNLLTNAFKYACSRPIHIRVQERNSYGVIEVEDQGPGIALGDQSRIFERFEQVEGRKSSGLGLGLFIARSIARAHGGDLRVQSEPGKGATFICELPLLQ